MITVGLGNPGSLTMRNCFKLARINLGVRMNDNKVVACVKGYNMASRLVFFRQCWHIDKMPMEAKEDQHRDHHNLQRMQGPLKAVLPAGKTLFHDQDQTLQIKMRTPFYQ